MSIASLRQSSIVCRTSGWSGISRSPAMFSRQASCFGKRAAQPFAQCRSPGAVHPDAERGVDAQLHSAGLVEEPFDHDFLLRRNDPERPESRAEVIRELARAGFAKTGLRSQPVHEPLWT